LDMLVDEKLVTSTRDVKKLLRFIKILNLEDSELGQHSRKFLLSH